ncbi:gas vesicle protein GvpG [Streptosporangium sp. NPDC051022]|uniref:gas vesicle protein GvpG n=1 Tax=Streptosporangium sp. NPDC051022 TaxID=3155752 RepID=UPI00342041BE
MDLLDLTFGLPFLPIRGLIRLAELIQEQVEIETRSPAAVRRQLEELEEAKLSGEITEEEEAEAVSRILERMTARPDLPGTAVPGGGGEEG